MIQCRECEHYNAGFRGTSRLTCDPFGNIKEQQCLIKWQLIKLDLLVEAQERMQTMYDKLAPLQEKMFRHLEREIDEAEEADNWKQPRDDEEDESDTP